MHLAYAPTTRQKFLLPTWLSRLTVGPAVTASPSQRPKGWRESSLAVDHRWRNRNKHLLEQCSYRRLQRTRPNETSTTPHPH